MILKIKSLDKRAILPSHGSLDAAAIDLYTLESGIIYPDEVVRVGTGIAVEIPKGYAGILSIRSSVGCKNGVNLANAPGLVDADYRGEIFTFLVNCSDRIFEWSAGDRLAQMRLVAVPEFEVAICDELASTERGEGSLGSTGQ